jgi:hypothetical protein
VQYIKQCDKNPRDRYSCYLYECCTSFGESEQKNDIRGCLLESEKKCSNLEGEARNKCRRRAHWECYTCAGAIGLGISQLINPIPECKKPMDETGGMWPW